MATAGESGANGVEAHPDCCHGAQIDLTAKLLGISREDAFRRLIKKEIPLASLKGVPAFDGQGGVQIG